MPDSIQLTTLHPENHETVAHLLHGALVHWYESRLRQGARFGDSHEPFRLIPEVYEALDPGECVAARDTQTNELLGVCFAHERETHVSLGIVATAPSAGGRGVARRMLEMVLERARSAGKPARLISSLLNLDSFSLYTRLGFVPGPIFQDMLIEIPQSGMRAPAPPEAIRVRLAMADEAARIADFEYSLQGIRREKDYAFFLRNTVGSWRVYILDRDDGTMAGFLVVSAHPSSNMIGPGVCADESAATALLWRALDELRGHSMVFLAPCAAAGLVKTAYGWGARNVELHVAQSTQPPSQPVRGITFPTFLPESA